MTTNPYEQLGRERKVQKLLDALDSVLGRPVVESDMDVKWSEEQLREVWKRADVKTPSAETWRMLAERIQEREKMQGGGQ